jgi:hypothetical protein
MPRATVSERQPASTKVAFVTKPVEEAQMGRFREVPILFLVCGYSLAQNPEQGSHSQPDMASELRVAVHVYNGVNLSSSVLSRAEQEAEKIFEFAGIQITWTGGVLGADVTANTPSARWDPGSLQLRVWSREMAGKRPKSSETLGFCLSLPNSDAVVFADAIQKRAVFGPTNFADLLGLAMAHELGHLLLRSASHSVTGIMRARWAEKQLRDDDRGYLRFTPAEAESMSKEARRRMSLESAC